MQKKHNKFLYGGDYYPNQWPEEIWDEDMEMFKKVDINSCTINGFFWARLQPAENTYDFSELDKIVDKLSREKIEMVFGTGTGTLPAWMFKDYPEVARTDYYGRRHKFGQRHNACPNSLVYQKYARVLVEKLAERYGDNEQIYCWHINNEYSGECYCENCEKAFRVWLKDRYGTLEALNKAWNMEFWGHNVYSWDEVVLPNALSEGIGEEDTAFAGISIDYRRFMSDSILENFKMERDAVRKYQPDALITTNLLGVYKWIDDFKWAKEMDIVSWDNYPSYDTPWSHNAMCHDLMRGLKKGPFMLMEQTPSQQNWQPYNSLKRPGQMKSQSYQAIAHGADTILFFQMRRSVGGCEKFHGAVIAHVGTDNTRVFREVGQLGEELKRIGSTIIGSANIAKVGIIFDWENFWALEYTSGPNRDLKYLNQIQQYYDFFYNNNIAVDMISDEDDFQSYDLVVAPVLYMIKGDIAKRLEAFVGKGGSLVTGFMSGLVDASDNVILGGYPGPLRKLAGVWVEEIDALAPEQSNKVVFDDGTIGQCKLVCDIMHLEDATAIANYASDFYKGTPAVTRNDFADGKVYYIGTELEEPALAKVLALAVQDSGVRPIIDEDTKLEVICRETDKEKIYFINNLKDYAQKLPDCFAGEVDLLEDKVLTKGTMLSPWDIKIVKREIK